MSEQSGAVGVDMVALLARQRAAAVQAPNPQGTPVPDQPAPPAPAPETKPAPAPETVQGRFLTRMDTDDFAANQVLTDPPKALHDKHNHRLRRLQDVAPTAKGA